MTADDKYIVFKRNDWLKLHSESASYTERELLTRFENDHALDDAVVIRTRDAFAASALHTYANSIAIAARVLGELAPTTRDRLQGIADYFHQRAVEASEVKTKLPD